MLLLLLWCDGPRVLRCEAWSAYHSATAFPFKKMILEDKSQRLLSYTGASFSVLPNAPSWGNVDRTGDRKRQYRPFQPNSARVGRDV